MLEHLLIRRHGGLCLHSGGAGGGGEGGIGRWTDADYTECIDALAAAAAGRDAGVVVVGPTVADAADAEALYGPDGAYAERRRRGASGARPQAAA